ncbi:MAG TPA: tRNA uridine-5-carboxymethylaminomethyl(34) synthesis enzyme MnmG, partial [Candidatus Izemoplasmatales bacterium]|nr:tRNA uridine-5-carboxymethylaminomethyl(34) synthesis enzyme MnmG [Candidatus Izemoplasmatales bacterium]
THLAKHDVSPIKGKTTLHDLFKRPETNAWNMKEMFPDILEQDLDIYEQIDTEIKYEGYIAKASREAQKLRKDESILIPEDIDYGHITNLALEARSKLAKIRPVSIAQASRISGVNPSDSQALLFYLRTRK